MTERRALVRLTVSLAAAGLLVACTAQSRYRVLSFFFDGVPEPGSAGKPSRIGEMEEGSRELRPARERGRIMHAHPPYEDGLCRECHNPDNGLLHKTVEGGLCQMCHPDVPSEVGFLHGPVAINDCLECHDPHQTEHRPLLRAAPGVICFRCHKRTDLTEGGHHEEVEGVVCTECHHPHGGDDRFFLR